MDTKQRTSGPTSEDKERFTFFYSAASVFSQFHPKKFRGAPLYGNEVEPIEFRHCEQWMMYNKALLFEDRTSAQQVLEEVAPQRCKSIGRKVKNFDEKIWKKHNEDIVYHGNKYKFTQNPDLLQALKDTEGTTLVEASPRDRLYGIGMSSKNPKALNRSTWRGQNLLGLILTRLRNDIC